MNLSKPTELTQTLQKIERKNFTRSVESKVQETSRREVRNKSRVTKSEPIIVEDESTSTDNSLSQNPEQTIDEIDYEPTSSANVKVKVSSLYYGTGNNSAKRFYCIICHKEFRNTRHIRNHHNKHHQESDGSKEDLHCRYCGELFENSALLKTHNDLTHNKRNLFCIYTFN